MKCEDCGKEITIRNRALMNSYICFRCDDERMNSALKEETHDLRNRSKFGEKSPVSTQICKFCGRARDEHTRLSGCPPLIEDEAWLDNLKKKVEKYCREQNI